jgi:hypothetical protein
MSEQREGNFPIHSLLSIHEFHTRHYTVQSNYLSSRSYSHLVRLLFPPRNSLSDEQYLYFVDF